jgi:uncharacterized protein (TIGR00251 family)
MGVMQVRVVPNARVDACVDGIEDSNTYRIRLRAPAVEGKANRALVAFLSDALGISKSAFRMVRGEKARIKVIEVVGLETDEIRRRLIGD